MSKLPARYHDCTVKDCVNKQVHSGLCSTHLRRLYRHGDIHKVHITKIKCQKHENSSIRGLTSPNNPNYCRACRNVAGSTWRRNNPEKAAAKEAKQHYKKYGPLAEVVRLLNSAIKQTKEK